MSSPSHLAPCPRPLPQTRPCLSPIPCSKPGAQPSHGSTRGCLSAARNIWPEPPPPGTFAQTAKFAPCVPCRRQRQALPRSSWLRSHVNRVPNLDHTVLVSCKDLTGVKMGWVRNNPIMVFQTTIIVVHNIYGAITDLNTCFQFFSAKFLENIVIALDSKTSILDSNFVGYGVPCKVF